jgi:16S rRNA (adenine1518-N6/adenine1519-N6)-dimethyltransferase
MAVASHTPRKRFGQNFLVDPNYVERIVAAVDPRPGDNLVEIGPGLAALTARLVAGAGRITAIEIDRDLAARLRARFGAEALDLREADALDFDFGALGSDLRVVGNLPYNISTPILFHLLEHVDVVADQHFMLQKEVVDRMTAQPATADYGRLSVMLQWRYEMEDVLHVPPQAFDPPPKVDSAVVRMVPREHPEAVDAKLLSEIVQVAFSQRRKILRHTLGKWLDARKHAGEFDAQRRAEEVPVAEYIALALAVA